MKKELSIYHLFVVTMFIGILLTCALFYGINSAIGRESTVADACYDGSVIEGEGFFADFDRSVYQNASVLGDVLESQYRLFGIVGSREVIAGKDDFLFEIEGEDNSYPFLEDYLGGLRFTEEECARILEVLQKRRDAYEARGAEYLLVVLPNAQSVYSEKMPDYLGPIRETRLAALEKYLNANGFTDFANLTDELIGYKSAGALYNNTENSLNALGLYYAYRCIWERFEPTIMAKTRVIPRDDLHFYHHLTTGKAAARRAGLADVVHNQTVSLSNNTKLNYHSSYYTGRVAQTVLLPFEYGESVGETPRLLLQFSGTWERLQSEPFFSNTFRAVTYQTDLADDSAVFEWADPSVVIQFLYEDQLSWLLPH
jgi:hypothetical protein